ncbi:MAG: hypothetical protein ACR2P2_10365 [Nakamurella sp.]
MGLDDLIKKAKDLLGGASAKTKAAADSAAAGDTDAAAGHAKEAGGPIDKAKEVLTDDKVDNIAGAIKDKTPDNVDSVVDKAADKGKDLNN